ncbi:MAG: hypothetical protein EBR12_05385 [Proteobacteria bacterium]|nr:hypothetical protein [Pseudomonadota bacterium]
MKLHRFPFNSQNSHLAPKSLPQTLSYGVAKRNFCLMPDKGKRFIYFSFYTPVWLLSDLLSSWTCYSPYGLASVKLGQGICPKAKKESICHERF